MFYKSIFKVGEWYMDNIVFSLDIGTRSIIGAVVEFAEKTMEIKAQFMLEHDSRTMYDGQIHDIPKVADGVIKVKKALEDKVGYKLDKVAIAAAGRSLKTKKCSIEQEIDDASEIDSFIVGSLEIAALQKIQQEIDSTDNEGEKYYCVGYSVVEYQLNGYPISSLIGHHGKKIGVEILATFLPDSVVNSLYSVLHRAELEPINLTLEPIAAIDIAVPEDIRMLNLALVDIGAGTSDIAITRDGSISAYGMVPIAGDEITEAIIENYLVDFSTAEFIKKQLSKGKEISCKDILGIVHKVTPEEVIQTINNSIEQLAEKIAVEILNLNQNKPPKTVFCIGGGAQLPGLCKKIAEKLDLPSQRVAVRGRDMLKNVVKIPKDPIGGSEGITVLGIASVAYKKSSNNFMTIIVNGKEYRLFDTKKITVANALGLIGYSPKNLIPVNGKDLIFTVNGVEKKIFGELGKPAEVMVNGVLANLQTVLKDNDKVVVKEAVAGRDAVLALRDLERVLDKKIDKENCIITVNGEEKPEDYLIKNGDNIKIMKKANSFGLSKDAGKNSDTQLTVVQDKTDADQEASIQNKTESKVLSNNRMTVTVNGRPVELNNNYKPILVDIFNAIDFNPSDKKGFLMLKVNGAPAGYTTPLKDGDVIEIYWDN